MGYVNSLEDKPLETQRLPAFSVAALLASESREVAGVAAATRMLLLLVVLLQVPITTCTTTYNNHHHNNSKNYIQSNLLLLAVFPLHLVFLPYQVVVLFFLNFYRTETPDTSTPDESWSFRWSPHASRCIQMHQEKRTDVRMSGLCVSFRPMFFISIGWQKRTLGEGGLGWKAGFCWQWFLNGKSKEKSVHGSGWLGRLKNSVFILDAPHRYVKLSQIMRNQEKWMTLHIWVEVWKICDCSWTCQVYKIQGLFGEKGSRALPSVLEICCSSKKVCPEVEIYFLWAFTISQHHRLAGTPT